MIVSRNVTWTLYDPIHAFKQWHHVLKPGGKLVIFDANWHLHQFEPYANLAKEISSET